MDSRLGRPGARCRRAAGTHAPARPRRPPRDIEDLRLTGPFGHALNCALIVALVVNFYTGGAVALFYATTVILAAWRGAPGCEPYVVRRNTARCSLVLCSVPDQLLALRELRRVLRSGGELRFLEHVRAADPRKARLQRGLDRSGVWQLLAGGCHCARDTLAAIQAGGFRLERSRAVEVGPGWLLTNPHVLGRALAP